MLWYLICDSPYTYTWYNTTQLTMWYSLLALLKNDYGTVFVRDPILLLTKESSSILDWQIGHILEITSDKFVATNIVSDLEPMNLKIIILLYWL